LQWAKALDGLRGVLALVVAIYHLLSGAGDETLVLVANLSVFCFFLMSGYVLSIGYDGNPAAFLVRRVVRCGRFMLCASSPGLRCWGGSRRGAIWRCGRQCRSTGR